MPKTVEKAVPRKNLRIPKPIVDEVDQVVHNCGMYINRQQFVESAIVEKIERIRLVREREGTRLGAEPEITTPLREKGDYLLAHAKDTFLAHLILNTVKEKEMPADHLDLKQLGENIRRYIKEKAEREGRKITNERVDELTEEILRYHNEILEGLSLIRRL